MKSGYTIQKTSPCRV